MVLICLPTMYTVGHSPDGWHIEEGSSGCIYTTLLAFLSQIKMAKDVNVLCQTWTYNSVFLNAVFTFSACWWMWPEQVKKLALTSPWKVIVYPTHYRLMPLWNTAKGFKTVRRRMIWPKPSSRWAFLSELLRQPSSQFEALPSRLLSG